MSYNALEFGCNQFESKSRAAGVEEAGVEEVFKTGSLFYTGNRYRRSRAAGRGRERQILAGRTAGLEVRLYPP